MFFVYFFAILFSGLGTLAGLIVLIIGLSGSKAKTRNIGLIIFGLSIVILATSIVLSVRATVNKVKTTFVEPFQNLADSLDALNLEESSSTTSLLEDNRDYLMNDTCSNKYIKLSKEESYKANPTTLDSYFTYFGSSEFYRLPIIYPFAMHSWDSRDYGTLVNEENEPDIKYSTGKEENVIFNITHYNFDSKYILIKSAETQTSAENSKYIYLLYDIAKKTSKEFKSEVDLVKAAKKAGYKGETELLSLYDYDARY